ncbi:MAG: STAS domain-containing protein [Patescibacteria group bacterium]
MKIKVKAQGPLLVIAIDGRMAVPHDIATFDDQLSEIRNDGRGVIIDLTKCAWIPSSGLSILIYQYKQYRGAKLPICMVLGTNDKIGRIMVISRLAEVFQQYSTVEEAAEGMTSSSDARK